MQILKRTKKVVDEKKLKRAFAEEKDCEEIVTGEFMLIDAATDQVVALCVKVDDQEASNKLRNACLSLKNWTKASRGSGLMTTAKVFGYQPRNPIRQRPFCHKGVLAREEPAVHNGFLQFAPEAERIFKKFLPDQAKKQQDELIIKVKPDWRIKGTMYTSGIANNNNALGYHRDRGNFEDFWSAMVVYKKDIQGGNLVVCDYNIKINFDDDCIFFFNGMRWWHGVTPIIKRSASAYRFTIVYYALKEMWKCMTIEDELNHAIKIRQETELKRIKR